VTAAHSDRFEVYRSIPESWRNLFNELNGGRIPDGEPGIRDVDNPCDEFKPYGNPWEHTKEFGRCGTDGHYMCVECTEIDVRVYRERRDLCEDCAATLDEHQMCSAHCDQPAQTVD